MAGRCKVLLVDAPMAMLTLMALRRASRVMILRGVRSSFTMATIRRPDCLAMRRFFALTAWARPQPGRLMPRASARQLMVLAVPSMEQVPTPGRAASSIFINSSSVSLPVWVRPISSRMSVRVIASMSLYFPGSMGPPGMTMAGMFSLMAAISMPGTILSQPGSITMPSN